MDLGLLDLRDWSDCHVSLIFVITILLADVQFRISHCSQMESINNHFPKRLYLP